MKQTVAVGVIKEVVKKEIGKTAKGAKKEGKWNVTITISLLFLLNYIYLF